MDYFRSCRIDSISLDCCWRPSIYSINEFKSNVTIAKTSTGTLDSQMAIYEESWKAASNRLRTAWEGLWDSLINSDSFTTILDGMASFVGMLEKMVDGIGGAGGVLTTFGGKNSK